MTSTCSPKMRIPMSTAPKFLLVLLLAPTLLGGGVAAANGLEEIASDGAHERIRAIEGVVLVDLFADW